MARILSVSYDSSLLKTRQLILEQEGHQVVSALGFTDALQQCESSKDFDLFILGHSIPHRDKEALITAFRVQCPAPVVALKTAYEQSVTSADFEVEPEPSAVVDIVSRITSGRTAAG